jgi:hypothetical protein
MFGTLVLELVCNARLTRILITLSLCRNVSRCWAYETSILTSTSVPDSLPSTPYDAFFYPDYKLHPPLTGRVDNLNTRASLEKIRISIREKLRFMNGAPSVQMQEIPPDLMGWMESEERNAEEKEDEAEGNGTEKSRHDGHRKRNEFFDSEHDGERDVDTLGGGPQRMAGVEEESKPEVPTVRPSMKSGSGGANGATLSGAAGGKGKTKSRSSLLSNDRGPALA